MIHIETGFDQQTTSPMVLAEDFFFGGTVTASSEVDGSPGTSAGEQNTYDGWLPSAMPATLTSVLASDSQADCLCIGAHDLGTQGATVILEYLDGSWQEAASFSPTDDSAIVILFSAQTSDEWRIRLTGATAPFIGFMMIGERTVFSAGITGDYTPTNWGTETELLSGISVSGQFIGTRVKKRLASTRIRLGLFSISLMSQELEDFVLKYNDGEMFFYAGYPSVLPKDAGLCRRSESSRDLNPTIVQGDLIDILLEVDIHVPA